jgi:hypothetical protein
LVSQDERTVRGAYLLVAARRINLEGHRTSSGAGDPPSTSSSNSATGTPIWMYVIGFAVLAVMLVVVLLHLSGTSFGH